jgi:betaine-aldehyde dehydrogenase
MIVSHRHVDMVAFTGSTPAGRAIGRECALLTKPAHLELGGKDPAIVFSDVDPTIAARGVVWATMLNAGQVCTSTERAYVHRSRYDEFVDRAVEIASTLRVGDPLETDTQIGPMRTEAGRNRVRAHVASAVESGATVLTGGSALDRPGFFFAPTVVVDVDHSMDLMREETFGPVLPIMPFDDVDEAFRLAADTEYGLGASIYTRDPVLVERAVRELRVGGVWVNDPVVDNPAGLLAGTRASGNGRELGIEGLHAFTTVRHLHWNLDLVAKPWWYPGGDR